MQPLDGSIAKFNRARNQIKALNETIAATLNGYTYSVVIAERDRDPSYRVLRLRTEQDALPIEWSAIVGEIAHDLRSSLDLLACQLAILNPANSRVIEDVVEKVSFPILLYGPRSKRPESRWRRNTGGLFKRKHKTLIEGLQPYHRRNGQRLSPLWLLHELNNADKHRFIQIAMVSASVISPRRLTLSRGPDVTESPMIGGIEVKQGVPFKNGAKIGRIEINSQGNVKVDVRITAEVRFNQGCEAVKGFHVMSVLVGASNAVNETLRLFSGEFR
ncbi:MAG: hypothetical protein HYX93_00975 [Chloroflexi bacterium]|nr:hypothetical protein [Chloroflexota bacterium]